MFEQFTDRARRVVVLAQEESRLLNHNYIGTEHLLLGLLHEGEGVGAQALASLDVSLQAARKMVEEIIGAGSSPPSGHIPFTGRAKKVLELSLRESLQLGDNFIGTEHLLLGLIREGEGVAAQVLLRLGADLAAARAAVVEIVKGMEPEERRQAVSTKIGAPEGERAGVPVVRAGRPSSSTPVGDEDELGPNCPNCRVPLVSSLAWERMSGVGEGSERIPMVVAFCMDCGTTVGVLPDTEPVDPHWPASGSSGEPD